MNAQLKEALEEAYKVRGLSNFVIEHGGNPVGSVKKGFAAAVKRAKLEDVSPHVLRHTAAVWLAEAGWPMSAIARLLGHKDSRITERVYAKFSPDYMKNMVEALAV
jgi:integrase